MVRQPVAGSLGVELPPPFLPTHRTLLGDICGPGMGGLACLVGGLPSRQGDLAQLCLAGSHPTSTSASKFALNLRAGLFSTVKNRNQKLSLVHTLERKSHSFEP
jgi:hypothetical protein